MKNSLEAFAIFFQVNFPLTIHFIRHQVYWAVGDREFHRVRRRHNICEEFSNILSNINVFEKHHSFLFKEESAVGDGVSRDAIAEFIDNSMQSFDGEVEKVRLRNQKKWRLSGRWYRWDIYNMVYSRRHYVTLL